MHLRDKVRERQRFTAQAIELFIARPAFNHPGEHTEESIAKLTYVRSKNAWHIFRKRADGKWHRYPLHREAASLEVALAIVQTDTNGCFLG